MMRRRWSARRTLTTSAEPAPGRAIGGDGIRAIWPELLVFFVALAFRASLLLRIHGTLLDGGLLADEATYWKWSEHILHSGPVGPNPFFMGPLYPYALALLRSLFHLQAPFGILVVQALLGSIACALLANAARRITSTPVALIMGLLLGAYRMAIFHDALILMESLLFFLSALLVWVAVRAGDHGCGPWSAAALGALVGIASEGRALFVLLLFTLWPVLRTGARSGLAARVALAIGTFALICAPAAWHNQHVSGEFIPFTYNLGMNLFIGNHDGGTGTFALTVEEERADPQTAGVQGGTNEDGRRELQLEFGRPLGPTESSREWARRALRFWRDDPAQALGLTARKVALLLSWRETPQVESTAVFERIVGPIGLVPFWLIAVLGLPALLVRGSPSLRFLQTAFLVLATGTVAFFVVDRYRLHLVPFLAPLAANSLERVRRAFVEGRFGALAAVGVRMAAAGALVCLPVVHLTAPEEEWSTVVDLGERSLERGDPGAALRFFGHADSLMQKGVSPGSSLTGRMRFAEFQRAVAGAAIQIADTSRALAALEEANRLVPRSLLTRNEMLLFEALANRREKVRRLETGPTDAAEAARNAMVRADESLAAGDTAAAGRLIEAAVVLDSAGIAPREARIRLAIDSNRFDRAEALLATDAGLLGASSTSVHRALLAWQAGDVVAARRALASLPADASFSPPTRAVVDWLGAQIAARPDTGRRAR